MLMVLPLEIDLTGALSKYKDLLETQLGRGKLHNSHSVSPHTTESSSYNPIQPIKHECRW